MSGEGNVGVVRIASNDRIVVGGAHIVFCRRRSETTREWASLSDREATLKLLKTQWGRDITSWIARHVRRRRRESAELL